MQNETPARTVRTASRWRRGGWFAVLVGIGFGAVLAPQIWPEVRAWIHSTRSPESLTQSIQQGPLSRPMAPPLTAAQRDVQSPAGTRSSVSQDPLPLVLTGTVVAANPAESVAFIGVDEKNP